MLDSKACRYKPLTQERQFLFQGAFKLTPVIFNSKQPWGAEVKSTVSVTYEIYLLFMLVSPLDYSSRFKPFNFFSEASLNLRFKADMLMG